jgi:hypothetical protein
MIKANMKRMLISATIVLGAALASPGPAIAQWHIGDEELYHYYYFNDENFSQSVGEAEDRCNSWGISRHQLHGTATPYFTSEIWAYCRNGQLSLY